MFTEFTINIYFTQKVLDWQETFAFSELEHDYMVIRTINNNNIRVKIKAVSINSQVNINFKKIVHKMKYKNV